MNLAKAVRGIALGAALVCFSVSGHAQSISLPFGGMLGTAELAVMVRNLANESERAHERLKAELASVRRELEVERKVTLSLAQGFDKLSRQHRTEMADTRQSQERAQEELTRLRDVVQKLEQERVALEGNLSTLRAQVTEITRQPGRTPDGANR
jgi:hypothetical protein